MAKKARTITDEEIALAKAMLKRGLRNDQIHYYFNRPDRYISSGRVTQIKQGKYGRNIQEATAKALDEFLVSWSRRQAGVEESPTEARIIRALFASASDGWVVTQGETDTIECKASFRISPEERFADIIKAIAGLANNKGGYILFGVTNGSFAVQGLSNNAFSVTDPAEINRVLVSALDPVPRITKTVIDVDDKLVGVIHVEKHPQAPIVALKNIGKEVREGTIYYRYVGETRAVKPGELRQILAEREQRAIADFAQRMSRVAVGTEATVDLETGEVKGRSGSLVIDQQLLPDIQFLREGDSTEATGAIALRLSGAVEPADASERDRIRIIRDNVTPDAVVRNFLRGEQVADPMQYIHAHAHCQRRWLPVWYYVRQAKVPIDDIVEDLRSQVATHPSSRDAVVRRLRKTEAAFRVNVGRPVKVCSALANGEIVLPSGGPDDLVFANAVMGLPVGTPEPERLKSALLECLDRAEGAGNGALRSAVYRAVCRLDELLNC